MNIKRITNLFLLMLLITTSVNAQNGLESIIVEKYYVSDATDAAGSIGVLPVGSVTYRIYADLLPGYEFQAAYGVPGHSLTISTSTSFFNNEDRGATTPTYNKTQARGNSVMLDSWLSVGAACVGNLGVMKSEDDVALGGATVVNNAVPPMLQNADASAGIALTVQDGLFTATVQPVTFVGITSVDLALFDATSQVGNSFTTSNGSWASLNGSTGAIASSNKVLIAQMTTDGVFHYELNIQIGTPIGGVENYVASNPVGNEIVLASLTGTLGGSNATPTVSITSPSSGASFITGAVIPVNASAADSDGSITSVEFFVDGISIGTDNSAPYTSNYTSTAGSHSLTAVATDNSGAQTTSVAVSINVSNNPPPSINITAPANGTSFITGAIVNITATASDNGSVSSVEFFVDGVSVGTDNSSPYSANYTSVSGSHSITATATDNLGAQSTSATILISVGSNPPPSINITSPSSGSLFIAPAMVTITADASDANGTITQVQFYVNGSLVGTDASAPYSFGWTSIIGSANITAVATDNLGATTTSSGVLISIADPNIPYKIITSNNTCHSGNFCLPVTAISTINNVIGYDMVMQYNPVKIRATGVITVSNDMINPSYVDIASSIDSINGLINISLYFNTSAPANTEFNGTGDIFCVEFSKKAGFNSTDTATFSISSLQESYISGVSIKLVDPGKYITYKDSTFNGSLKFWFDNSPIKYNASSPSSHLITNIFGNNSTCSNNSIVAVQPDTTGNFKYSVWNGQYISIQKDISGTTSVQPVVNGFDALQARKVLINDPGFTPSVYQMIAMDVNTDGVVSAGDVSQINQRAVLMIPEFKQAWNYNSSGVSNGQLSKDWLFIDSLRVSTDLSYRISTTFPADDGIGFSKWSVPVVPFCLPLTISNFSTCPQITNESYKGVLLGDIDGNFSSVSPNGIFRFNENEKIFFDVANAIISDEYIDIPISFGSDFDVYSLDLAMEWNEDKLTFNSIINHSNSMQLTGNYNINDRVLRITSNGFQKYISKHSLLSVRFNRVNKQVNQFDFSSFEGYLNGKRTEVEILNKESNSQFTEDISINIYPNPVNDILRIQISQDAIVKLFGIDGRPVSSSIEVKANSSNSINMQNLAAGIYLMSITSNGINTIRKIVVE